MKLTRTLFCGLSLVISASVQMARAQQASSPDLATPQEKHLRNVRQLTFGGSNAEAYFSADGKKLIFQSTRDQLQCDQIFTMNVDGSDQKMVSTGKGRTTCGYIFPHQDKILYSSTHLADPACPPRPDYSKGYVWAVRARVFARPKVDCLSRLSSESGPGDSRVQGIVKAELDTADDAGNLDHEGRRQRQAATDQSEGRELCAGVF